MTKGPSTPAMYCRICLLPLDSFEAYDKDRLTKIEYRHPEWQDVDHEPDPAMIEDYTEIKTHCDFCLAPVRSGGWTFPCADFEVLMMVDPDRSTTHTSSGDWSACDECHLDIHAGRWEAMLNRNMDNTSVPERMKPMARVMAMNLWEGFRAHRTGRPYHEGQKKSEAEKLEIILERMKEDRG